VSAQALDHVLVLSDDIDASRDFYCRALGMSVGERPPLPFPGHWLYDAGGGPACTSPTARSTRPTCSAPA
jgi:catechol 2,3-dioxygenase-like lactoylglutathione lyase family enzyme